MQNCPTCTSCSPILGTIIPVGVQAVAKVVNYDNIANTVDSTGSIGDHVKLVIKRSGLIIETSAPEVNTGTNQIAYVSVLQNGDVICIHATYDNFATYDEDCKTIPIPLFGFTAIN